MKHTVFWTTLFALCICMSGVVKADLVDFVFDNGGPLDSSGPVGNTQTGTDQTGNGVTATLTVTEILTPEYDATFVRTGNTLSASAGGGGVTSIPTGGGLGINNQSINNDNFDALGTTTNNGTEGNDFNPDEALFFTFDEDVIFTQIEVQSFLAGDSLTVSVAGTDTFTITTDGLNTNLGGLSGLLIAAGTEVGIRAAGTDDFTSVRVENFQVDVVTAIPEPTSIALMSLLGIGFVTRRRR